jgi:hypothetical protein
MSNTRGTSGIENPGCVYGTHVCKPLSMVTKDTNPVSTEPGVSSQAPREDMSLRSSDPLACYPREFCPCSDFGLVTIEEFRVIEQIENDRRYAATLHTMQLQGEYYRQRNMSNKAKSVARSYVYNFVRQSAVLKENPVQRRPKDIKLEKISPKVMEEISDGVQKGLNHKNKIHTERSRRRILNFDRAQRQQQYQDMQKAPTKPKVTMEEFGEKLARRAQYETSLWSKKVARNKQHAQIVYEAKGLNKKFVPPLSWDQKKPSKTKVAPQKVPPQDFPYQEEVHVVSRPDNQANWMYDDDYNCRFAPLMDVIWPAMCARLPKYDGQKLHKWFENIYLLYINLRQCVTWTHMSTVLLAWVSNNYTATMTGLLTSMIQSIVSSAKATFQTQAGGSGMLDKVREAFATWNDVMYGEVLTRVKKIMALLVAAGICSFAKLPFGSDAFEAFYKASGVDKLSSIDMITQIMDTIIFMWERGLAFFTTGRWRSFFTSYTLPQKFELEYAFLLSKVDLLQNGLLTKMGIEESEYLSRVDTLLEQTKEYIRTVKSPYEKKILTDKLLAVERLKTTILVAFKAVVQRRKPYTFMMFGTTNLGKTVTVKSLANAITQFCGLPSGSRFGVSLNCDDKYQSEVEAWHTVYYLDDLAATKADYADGDPTQLLINLSNNEPKYALKAGVESKGQVLMNPLLLIGTTNVKGLDTDKRANFPIATMRRFEAIVTPTVRPEYALPDNRGLDTDKTDGLIGEYCTFTVERAIPVRSNPGMADRRNQAIDTVGYQVIDYLFPGEETPRSLDNVSYHDLLVFLTNDAKKHLEKQAKLVEEMETLHLKKLCEHSSYPEVCPKCLAKAKQEVPVVEAEEDLNRQAGVDYTWALTQYRNTNHWIRGYLHRIPKFVENKWSRVFDRVVSNQVSTLRDYAFISMMTAMVVTVPAFSLVHALVGPLPALMIALCVYTYVLSSVLKVRFARTLRALAHAPFNELAGSVKQFALVGPLLFLSTAIGIVYYARKSYSQITSVQNIMTQGEMEQVPVRDKVQRINHWKPVHVSKPPVDLKLHTATNRQVCDIIGAKLCRIKFRRADSSGMACNALPLQSNVWLIPYHCTQEGFVTAEVSRCAEGHVGPTFTARIAPNVMKQVGGTDLAVVYLPAGGSQADLLHLFPHDVTRGMNAGMCIYKRPDGSLLQEQVNTKHVRHHVGQNLVEALSYVMNEPTFNGLCMATLVSLGKVPYILGLHIGGYGIEDITKATKEQLLRLRTGIAVQVTKQALQQAIDALYTECQIAVKVANEAPMDLNVPEKDVHLTGDLHYKSPLKYIDQSAALASVTAFGSHTGRRRAFRSDCIESFISKHVAAVMDVPNNYGPPKNMGSYEPWRADTLNLVSVQDLPPDIVEKAYVDLRAKIFAVLKEDDKKYIHPYTWDVALAGADGVYGVDGLNLNTSTGWPGNDKKWKILVASMREVEGITRPLDMPEGMEEELVDAEERLANGERMYFVHRANLKDEPTRLDKTKVRVFAGSPLKLSILVRKYYLSIFKYIMEHPIEFECAVGVNAHGPEWSRLIKAMTKFGTERMIAGDYKAFDSTMCAMISLLGFKLMIEIAAWAGYSPRQLAIMLAIATEVCYPVYEYNGEFVMYAGGNPSGHSGTVFINNFAGSLYYRVAYYALTPLGDETPLMHNVVSFLGYGDDNGCSVAEGYDWFNHTAIAQALGEYGVVYTMADKVAESVPYISLDDLEFLKRTPVWNEDYQLYMAPIKEASIMKSLHCVKFSKSLTKEEHAAACIVGAVSEYFQHGRAVYEDRIEKLRQVIQLSQIEAYIPDRRLPSFDEMEYNYKKKYFGTTDETAVEEVEVVERTIDQAEVLDGYISDEYEQWINEFLAGYDEPTPRVIARRAQMSNCRTLSAGSLKRPYLHRLPTQHRISKRRCVYRHADLEKREQRSQRRYTTALSLHSGELDGFTDTENQTYNMSSVTSIGAHQNLTFRDGAPQWGVGLESAMDNTRMVATHDDVTLGEFLSRPVQIASYNWAPGTAFTFTTMNPWDLFFSQSRVINRINNYGLIQPKQLKVKININGTSFHYGRLLVHYLMLHNNTTSDPTTAGRFTLATQRMHLTLDPCTSQGGEFTLPYVWPYNASDLTVGQWDQLGVLNFEELNPLKHANGGTAAVNITVYAWAEDVKLSIPTTLNSTKIVAQADEFGVGSVGRTASAVSKAAGMLSSVPGIAPFAKATSMVASGMGAVAKAYGFSRPPIISDLANMRPTLVGTMANTDRGDTVTKLTVDSKQELTIDPRVFGVDTGDELVLTNLAGKQAYLTQFQWIVGTPPGTIIWNIRVNPGMNQFVTNAGYLLLPCAFASLPFKWWRGTIRYRFQIVASAYHKGRLRFVYDPHRLASNDQNVAYTRVIDLANERDFTLDVAWGQPVSWLRVPRLPYTGANGSTTAYSSDDTTLSNGVVTVAVLNDLTTPNDVPNNDITINVYASMCDDAEFNVLDNTGIEGLTFKNQAEEFAAETMVDDNAPLDIGSKECMSECLPVDNTLLVHFGESVTSFRTVLKRYNYHVSYQNPTVGQVQWQLIVPTFPHYPGLYTTGINQTATVPSAGVAANFNKMTLMNYLTPAFLAQRGSIRSKYNFFSDLPMTTNFASVARIISQPVPATYASAASVHVTTNQNLFTKGRLNELTNGLQAIEVTYTHAQPTLEVEHPYYNLKRFDSARDPGYTQTSGTAGFVNMAPSDSHIISAQMNSTAYSGVDRYIAAGEDFQLFLFQGLPAIFVQTFT